MTRIALLGALILTGVFIPSSRAFSQRATLVADINPFPGDRTRDGSYPHHLIGFEDALYFTAYDDIHGNELWKWDGTSAAMVDDILVGKSGSDPADFIIFDDSLYFTAFHESDYYSRDLWKLQSDQLTQVTTPDVVNLNLGSFTPHNVIVDDSLLFVGRKDTLVPNFNGTNATLTILAQELWTWSGSELSQVTDIYSQFAEPPFSGPSLDGLCVFNDRLYFVVHSQLWSWDGNSATPADELSEIHRPYELTAIDEQLFFTGEEAEIGHELCIWNGFDEPIVLDLNVGLKSSSPEQFTQLGNDVFFVATDNLHGRELWKWNGTEAQIVADIYPGRESSDVSSLTVFNGELYFAAYTKEFGRELWKWDGREATMVTDISPAEFRWAPLNSLTEFDNALFFAGTDAEHGTELWKLQAIPEPSGFLLALGGFALVMQLRRRH